MREDAWTLFGFGSAGERDAFRALTSVQGVGGRVALAILSALSPDELARAVAQGDKAMIGRANGVGPKLAARIANELQGKLGPAGLGGAAPAPRPEPPPTPSRRSPTSASARRSKRGRQCRQDELGRTRRSTRWCGWH